MWAEGSPTPCAVAESQAWRKATSDHYEHLNPTPRCKKKQIQAFRCISFQLEHTFLTSRRENPVAVALSFNGFGSLALGLPRSAQEHVESRPPALRACNLWRPIFGTWSAERMACFRLLLTPGFPAGSLFLGDWLHPTVALCGLRLAQTVGRKFAQ